ncbi:MAG: NADH:flavin oxidoreductase [Candidatus Jordarchaeales archaeon]|nr:NADH:flavin oxidoreductase [Candidatus Jordarchaeia archaeon]
MLFEPGLVGPMEVKNRIVRSATYEGLADENGIVGERYVELYRKLAKGGTGLIITGFAYVRKDGIALRGQAGLYSDACVPPLRKMVEAVREVDPEVKVVVQLSHGGRQAHPKLTGGVLIAPSPIPDKSVNATPREMTREEVKEVIEDFVSAAERAKDAGFDGVQIQACHGYLVSQFLSPYSNRRNDEYGGSTENRARMLIEMVRGMKKACGRDWPVLVKLQMDDFVADENRLKLPESVEIARMVSESGADAIEVSGGIYESSLYGNLTSVRTNVGKGEPEAYFLSLAIEAKKALPSTPIMLVGGIRSKSVAEEIIEKRYADFISMSRPLIRDPDLPMKWMKGEGLKSDCASCNDCLRNAGKQGLRCSKQNT